MSANAETDVTRIAIIMAGGVGERFWPLSRRSRPKQLLNLTRPDTSLLEEAVERLTPLVPPERVFVVTGKNLQGPIQNAGLAIPKENVVAEPCKRNTAGCLVYAAAVALSRFGGDPSRIAMGVVTADHKIEDREAFRATLASAFRAAESSDALVTIGIKPTRPETGYGYIEIPGNATPQAGSDDASPVYTVRQFREKPDLLSAETFVKTGRFLWNSGMFFWRISSFLKELDEHAKPFADATRQIHTALADGDQSAADTVFAALPNKSIDYVLMEQAEEVMVAPGTFVWDDVGAWDALDRTLTKDENGNVAVGDPVLVDAKDCIVYNDLGPENMAVACVGTSNVIVVVTKDGVVVVPKDRAQDVKAAVQQLKDANSPHL